MTGDQFIAAMQEHWAADYTPAQVAAIKRWADHLDPILLAAVASVVRRRWEPRASLRLPLTAAFERHMQEAINLARGYAPSPALPDPADGSTLPRDEQKRRWRELLAVMGSGQPPAVGQRMMDDLRREWRARDGEVA